jgi:hypothetical protein
MELYQTMYPARQWNANAFMRWLKQAQAAEQWAENLKSLHEMAADAGYKLVKA